MAASSKTQNIQISFVSPGARPPIFVAGSFTDPPWQPQELDYVLEQPDDMRTGTEPEPSQYRFVKTVQVGQGRWQYKFRLGLGDWWVCDENTEKVTDELGNENNLLTVKAPQFPLRGPDNVLEHGTLGEETYQATQFQEGVKEKVIAHHKPQSEAGRGPQSRKLDYTVESNEVEELDARLKSQDKKWSPTSQGQSTVDDEISGSLDSEAMQTSGLNKMQEKDQEKEASHEEKPISAPEVNGRQHLPVQGGADPEGSRRRRTSGKPFSTSSLESCDNPEPSKSGFAAFWERLLEWLYSVFARLFSSERP